MFVSVIMPTYNGGAFIAEAVQSVLSQTHTHWELWIVDDASTDNTTAVLQPFLTDTRIHYHRLPKNGGAAAARSYALAMARGEYVAFLDSDDVWEPQKLERQLAFMQQQTAAGVPCYFSATAYVRMDEDGRVGAYRWVPPHRVGYWKMLFLSDPIGNSTVMYERRQFGDIRVPAIDKRNDFALWLAMLRSGAYCYGLPERLMRYRVRRQSLSSNKRRLWRYHWQLYRHIERLSWPIAALAMLCWAAVKGTGIGVGKQREE